MKRIYKKCSETCCPHFFMTPGGKGYCYRNTAIWIYNRTGMEEDRIQRRADMEMTTIMYMRTENNVRCDANRVATEENGIYWDTKEQVKAQQETTRDEKRSNS